MKLTRMISLLVCIAMLTLSLVGCSQPTTTTTTATAEPTAAATAKPIAQPTAEPTEEPETEFIPYTVTDMTGKEVTFDEPVERIVALTASDCEILYAIGAGDMLVGRGAYCDYPEEVLEVTAVESGAGTNIEEIIALEPQLLIMATMAQTEEQVKQLEDAGCKVIVSDAQDIAGVYTAIELIGDAVKMEEGADNLISSMKAAFDTVKQAEGEEPKTIYFEVSPLEYGLWTAGNGTFMTEAAEMIGCKNCFDDVSGWAEISEEQVIERDPDYIVTITMYFGEGPAPEEEIMSRTGWDSITAVKNKAILNLANNELSRPGPRLADGAQMLYDFVTK